ncbi:MAG: aldo/keto reductase, partial [Lachnospiraceae bacterium]|nr:aldo/keto reductase [Lachnospiraceae bacterium]
MAEVILGRTMIKTNKNGFGALPIQRVSAEYAGMLLRKAFAGGITFFDTARSYSDSEEKMGAALADLRKDLYLATKTPAMTADDFWRDLEISLGNLKTDYLDLYQFHNPAICPRPDDGTGLYEAMLSAKAQGLLRFIGLTNHRLDVAKEAVTSGLYDTLQFPLSYLATDRELELVQLCHDHNVGFIAMKGLSGGLITRADAAYAWLAQYDQVLPIWGIQREVELDQFLLFATQPPVLSDELQAVIARDQAELKGNFCRGCGYCMPCPAGIKINNCARMIQLI